METQNIVDRRLELDCPFENVKQVVICLHKPAMKRNSFLNMFLMVPVVTDMSLKERNFQIHHISFSNFLRLLELEQMEEAHQGRHINASKNSIPYKKMILLKKISVKRKRVAEINYYLLEGFRILNMIYLFWHLLRNIQFTY